MRLLRPSDTRYMVMKWLVVSLLLMGFSGMAAQVILLRELLTVFYGNELSIGIILAGWLLFEAAGAYAFREKKVRGQTSQPSFLFSYYLPSSFRYPYTPPVLSSV